MYPQGTCSAGWLPRGMDGDAGAALPNRELRGAAIAVWCREEQEGAREPGCSSGAVTDDRERLGGVLPALVGRAVVGGCAPLGIVRFADVVLPDDVRAHCP